MTSQNIWVWLHIFKVWRDLSKQSLSVPPRFRKVFRWIGTADPETVYSLFEHANSQFEFSYLTDTGNHGPVGHVDPSHTPQSPVNPHPHPHPPSHPQWESETDAPHQTGWGRLTGHTQCHLFYSVLFIPPLWAELPLTLWPWPSRSLHLQ